MPLTFREMYKAQNFVRVAIPLILTVGKFPAGDASAEAKAPGLGIQVVGSKLTVPWAVTQAPDGRLFVTERPGRIRIIRNGKLQPKVWRTLGVMRLGEMGLLGIALDPNFRQNRFVYVVGTYRSKNRFVNRVIRLTDSGGQGVAPKVLVDGIPAGPRHSGDAIQFGPDGKLYVATGDARQPMLAQNMKSLGGKILRYNSDGSVPRDNPFRGSPVYALGLRNPQGLAWDKKTRTLFATEHGPSGFRNEGGRRHHDELNVILPGKNYGWPIVSGKSNDSRFISPLVDWTPAIAPSGLAISGNHLMVGALKGQQLRVVTVRRQSGAPTGWAATNQKVFLQNRIGRIRAISPETNNALFVTTSNRDDNSKKVFPGDDKVFKVTLSNGF